MFINGGQYLACASSFILTRRGAKRLLEAMRGIELSGKVPINDMFYRQLIREGKLSAAITLPFLSTIAPLKDSAIQTSRDPQVSLSMHVDLTLRRLLYLQAWEPQNCSGVINQLAELLSVALASDDLETQILELIKAARSRGWLKSY